MPITPAVTGPELMPILGSRTVRGNHVGEIALMCRRVWPGSTVSGTSGSVGGLGEGAAGQLGPPLLRCSARGREEHGVDHVDDAVGRRDVRRHDPGDIALPVGDRDHATLDGHRRIGTVDRGNVAG